MTADPMRMPPFNLAAEQGVIGSCLLDPEIIDDVMMVVDADDFYRDSHQILWRAVAGLRTEGKPVDAIVLEDRLRATGELDRVGGIEAIFAIRDVVPHPASSLYYAQIVREKATARGLIRAANEIIEDGYGDRLTADEMTGRAEARVFGIRDRRGTSEAVPVSTLVDEATARAESRRAGGMLGLVTGYDFLDSLTAGFAPGNMIVLAARPSIGKSALAFNIAVNVASRGTGTPSLIVSLEMSRAEVIDRMLGHVAGVDGHAIKMGKASDHDLELMREARGVMERYAPILIDDSPSATVGKIGAAARRAKAKHGIGLLVVDYLQLVDPADPRANRQEQVAGMARSLKRIARELHIPVLVLSQVNRKSEDREDRRPRMSDLRESGAIEQDADLVLLLHRPEFYDKDDKPGLAELNVAKNRNGPTGAIELGYVKHRALFTSLDFRRPAPVQLEADH